VSRLAPGAVFAIAAAVLLTAGCGGGGKKEPFTLSATRSCLGDQSVKTTRQLGDDFVASTAPGGAMRADLGDNTVTISFGEDETQADQIATAYRRFKGKNIGIENVLRVRRNAVMLWEETPSPGDEAVVTDCLG
jgi:hypothetical protein